MVTNKYCDPTEMQTGDLARGIIPGDPDSSRGINRK